MSERNEFESLFERLWPLHRSITGAGLRRSLDLLATVMPLERTEIPSGTRVYDWTVPPEWTVREAHVTGPDGRRIVDVRDHTLHLVGYSVPFRGRLDRAELDAHLYSLPDRRDAIPYVTSYYAPRWGFCLPHAVRERLPDGPYDVVVDTDVKPGAMTVAEAVLPGASDEEVLFSTYLCHPSMANNELSGPLLTAFLYRRLARWPRRRLTYRFVVAPETIGAIAYLAMHGDHLVERTVAGYVVTCVGGPHTLTYKRSRDAPTLSDRAAEHVLRHGDEAATVLDFAPTGSDERQYGSPGFRLPVGSLMRTMYGRYREYHTSLDDAAFMSSGAVLRTLDAYEAVCRVLDGNERFINLNPHGEPELGRRGLYPDVSVADRNVGAADALLWVLNLADGEHDLLAVAERSGSTFPLVREAAERLLAAGLITRPSGGEDRAEETSVGE